jgi:6-phosphogluconolactonase
VTHVFESVQGLSFALSGKVINLARQSVLDGRTFHIAFSGGSTPRALFEAMAADTEKSGFWEGVNFYWVDERCVPPDHPESNFHLAEESFFRPLSINHDHVYRMRGEKEPRSEAARYEACLRSQLPSRAGLPRFDFILLGMGTDGHTASIFPDQMHLLYTQRICELARHPETGQQRITITGPVINNAEHVCFMITGREKAEVLARILEGGREAEKYPAAHIKPAGGRLEWYLDKASAQVIGG